jgi:hypothetical protein
MSDTPRTDAEILRVPSCFEDIDHHVVLADFARQLERDITELNERLIDRQKTLMEQAVKLQAASRLLTRCRDSAGRMEMGLYEDIQNYLHDDKNQTPPPMA